MRRIRSLLSGLALTSSFIGAATGCNAYRLKTPAGYAEVEKDEYGAHYKGSNNVGFRVNTFDNVKGGTLAFWSEDLVRKLGARGYTLTRQRAVESANGLPGTRFDFSYEPPGEDVAARTYSVALFVSDKHRVVMQLAGSADVLPATATGLDSIASATKIRGCRVWTDICKGPQPATMATSPTATAKANANAGAKTETTSETDSTQPDPTQIAEEGSAPQGG